MPFSNSVRDWNIYKITNPEGRIYIGLTHDLNSRLRAYKYTSGGGCIQQPILFNSLKKYKFENHIVDVIDTFTSDYKYAWGKEMFWIRSYMSNLNKWRDMNGMNLTNGGQGAPGHKWSEERKKKFSESRKGIKMKDSQKKKLSDYFKANPSRPMLGKKMSEETKLKMSLSKKGMVSIFLGKKHTEESNQKNREAHLGKPSGFKGKKWSEEDKARIGRSKLGNTYMLGKKLTPEQVEKLREVVIENQGVPLLIYDVNGVFLKETRTLKDACFFTKMASTSVYKILRGQIKNPKQFIFKYKKNV